MKKRLLDLNANDINDMSKEEKLLSIKMSEGRTLVTEIITMVPPLLLDISNVELAAGFGSDIILLNLYDVNDPKVFGIPEIEGQSVIETIKTYTGRMVGVNLEPVDPNLNIEDEKVSISKGRTAQLENVGKLIKQGVDFVVLTGNPKVGVTNEKIIHCVEAIKKAYGEKIIIVAGKMHAAGDIKNVGTGIVSKEVIKSLVEKGTDIILLPAPGTVPGMTVEYVKDMIDYTHSLGAMTLTTIGTSQEGADESTIKTIALYSKMAGTDMHHIGDCGYGPGIAIPENIMNYSIVIKGKRHTYRRMVRSVNRKEDNKYV